MVKTNSTIDNVSPSISYLPAADWSPSAHTDTYWTQYYLGTYSMSSKAGDNATFTFNGTGVWLYGALRSNHGLYNVSLDGVITTYDGFAPGAGLYQQPLFGASDLEQGVHTITLINNRNSTTYANLDLDFITWEEDIGDDTDTLHNQTDDDNGAAFTYGPAATAWSTVPGDLSQYYGSTGHTTVTSGAYVTYTFAGSAVSIYGALGPSQGPYSVQLDGGPAANYTAYNTVFFAQQPLYHVTGLANTTHTIQINNMPATVGQALDIDYAVVTSIQAPIVTTTSTSAVSTSSSATSSSPIDTSLPTQSVPAPSDKKGVSTGVIVAIVVGVLALLALLSFALMMFRRRQNNKRDEDDPDMITVYPEPYAIGQDSYGGTGRYIPPSQNMHDGYNPLHSGGSNGENSAPLYPPSRAPYDQQGFPGRPEYFPTPPQADGVSLFSGLAPGVPQQGVGRPRFDSSSTGHGYTTELASTVPYGRESAYTGVSNGSSRVPAHGHSAIDGADLNAPLPPIPPLPNRNSNPPLGLHQPTPLAPGLIPPQKGRVTLPASATPEQQHEFRGVSPIELQARRMNVDGREQDFGPIVMDDPLHVSQAPLPPNYAQATETFKR